MPLPRLLLALLGTSLLACRPPEVDTLHVDSELTGETYALSVLSPDKTAATTPLPTVWLLDAAYHFDALALHVDRRWRRDQLAPFRLVGVGYKGLEIQDFEDLQAISDKRLVDLSYPEDPSEPAGPGGGGAQFHQALVEELVPAVEEAYAQDDDERALFGHSLGGLFALLDPLLFAPEHSLFPTVVAASPAVSWADAALLDFEAERAARSADPDGPGGMELRLIIGTGRLEGTEMIASKDVLVRRLRSRQDPSLRIHEHDPRAAHLQAAEDIFEHALDRIHP